MALKIFSCNVKGLNSIHKRWLALKEFTASGADVVMVQEMPLRPGGSFKFASKMFPTAFMASDPSGRAGVAILIKRSCPLKITASTLDPHGRYVLLNCVHYKTPITLVNVYAPNLGQIGFLTKILERLHTSPQPFCNSWWRFQFVHVPQQGQTRTLPKTPHHSKLTNCPLHFGN